MVRRISSTMISETSRKKRIYLFIEKVDLTENAYDACFKGVEEALGPDVCKSHCYNTAVAYPRKMIELIKWTGLAADKKLT